MILLSLLLAGCGSFTSVNEDNYWELLAEKTCDVTERCLTLEFYMEWDEMDDCIDDMNDLYEEPADRTEACSFDEDKAKDCLDGYGESCQELADDLDNISEDCSDAWVCKRD